MLGLEMLAERKILVKVNSVMIPGINDEHLIEVNRVVKEKGAFLHNIMPLISDPAHGTHFGLTGQRGPGAMELKALQDKLSGGANLMRHCRQCRADAVGMLGEDRGQEFNMDLLPEAAEYDPSKRIAYRAVVAEERGERAAKQAEAAQTVAAAQTDTKVLVAIATKGGGRINQHFGHATEFQVYEVSLRRHQLQRPPQGGEVLRRRLGRRRNAGQRDCRAGWHQHHSVRQDWRLPEGQPGRRRHRGIARIRL